MNPKRLYVSLLCLGVAILGLSFYFYGYAKTWELWDISVFRSPFLDFQLLPASAESIQAGYDPAINNPFDPQQRIFNYPRIWYIFLRTSLNQQWTIPLMVVIIGLYFISLLSFPEKLTYFSVFLLLFSIFSPAALLGVERGNVDLIIFSCLSLAICLNERSAFGSFGILMASIFFKLFPLFGSGYFLGYKKKQTLKYLFATFICTIIYFIANFQDMLHIFSTTTKGVFVSYGWLILPKYFYQASKQMMMLKKFNFVFFLILFILAFGMVALAVTRWQPKNLETSDLRNRRAFWLGAGIYLGTFFLGNNWDYRLMFLLFTIPQLATWQKTKIDRLTKLIVWVTILTLVASCWGLVITTKIQNWINAGEQLSLLVDECANWILFGGLVYLYTYSLPAWIFSDLAQLRQKFTTFRW